MSTLLPNLKSKAIRTLPGAYEAITSLTGLTPKGRAQGVDVYGPYQGYFRPETATQRIDFAIQKLTEGTTIIDAKRDEIWSGVKQIGIRGAYHYQRSGVSWKAQADYFLDTASKYDHHFYALDVEKYNNTLNDPFAADMYRMINYWKEQAASKRIVLYSNKNLFETFIYPRIKALYGGVGLTWLVEQLDVWYAQYWLSPSVDKDPALPAWMTTWRLWQITASAFTGASFGVQSKEVDVDVYNGTPAEMSAWLGITSQPPVEPEPPPIVVEPPPTDPDPEPELQMWEGEIISTTRMIVRSAPVVAETTKTGLYLYYSQHVDGRIWSDGDKYLWLKITASLPSEYIGKWVAVRALDGSARYVVLRRTGSGEPIPPPAMPQLWQVLHDAQLGEVRQPTDGEGAPEVFPMMDKHFTRFTRAWQMLSYELMALPPKKWRAVFTWQRALTNNNGFESPNDPRADYVNRMDLTSPDPKVASLLFGGNVITGRVDGDHLWVETLNGNDPPPSVAWMKEHPWLMQVCTNVQYESGKVFDFPQGDGLPVIVLILASKAVKFPLKNLKKLPLGSPIPRVYWP